MSNVLSESFNDEIKLFRANLRGAADKSSSFSGRLIPLPFPTDFLPGRFDGGVRRTTKSTKKQFSDWEMDIIVDTYGHAILTLMEESTNFILKEIIHI